MTGAEKLLVFILVLNVLIVLLYLIVFHLFLKRQFKCSIWLKAFVMLLCPVVGPLCFFFSYLLFRLLFHAPVDLEDVVFSKERVKSAAFADEDKGRNLVPLEEAIAVSDKDSLRRLMMDVVRDDNGKSLATISKGLQASDTETVHYAASIMQEKLDRFRRKVQRDFSALQQVEDAEERARDAAQLLEYMDEMLARGVFGTSEQKSFVRTMDATAEILMEAEPQRMNGHYHESLCLRTLEADEIELAEKWCCRIAEAFPGMLASYSCRLRLYYQTHQSEQFRAVLDEMKRANLVVDAKALELIRIFG